MIIKNILKINDQNLVFNHFDNDETFYGAIAGLQQNVFKLTDINFQKGDVILDIGSNVGIISLVIAKLYPDVRIYAFDASKECIECLNRSKVDNNIHNLFTYHLAIGAKNEEVIFSYEENHHSCLQEESLSDKSENRKIVNNTVEKIKIDEIFESPFLNINKVKWLKCDIEGGEFEIFNHLLKNREDILDKIEYINLEIHRKQKFGDSPNELIQKLKHKFQNKIVIQD